MKIYLVGFMGAGKTTIGRELARRLETPFFDLDELVEAAEEMSIKEIFAAHGEPYFRKRERDLLRTTRYVERGVIATGGGTFAFDENIQFIQAEGYSVYLSAPFSLVMSRSRDKSAERPMFRSDDAALDLFLSRLKFYKLADQTVEIREDQPPAEIVERLLHGLPREAIAKGRP
jgi:shikimate kinase